METNELINSLRAELAEAKEKNEVLYAECNRRIAPQTLNLDSRVIAGDPPEAMEFRYMKDGVVYDPDKLIKENAELKDKCENQAKEIESLKSERNELKDCVIGMAFYMENSEGIAGWHQNGDVAEWDSLDLSMEGLLATKNAFALEQQVIALEQFISTFPSMLRKMWSAGEVREFVNEAIERLQAQGESK